ncbi:hypothetical protein SNE40_010801 [Patella caerulea]|uniref:CHCH domain-containing protein n=1 Tax=Patella caerulea TaxID=87958 RepID=A0AAN8JV54_PATCE
MAAPMAHDRTRRPDENEEEDPVETLINKTGCAKLHYAVQDCMAEHQDWRKCQKEVTEFRTCVEKNMKKKT